MLLRAGWSVVVDAAFLRHNERMRFEALAKDIGAVFAILAPQATPVELRQRIQARSDRGRDASEATLEVLEQQMRQIEPLTALERGLLLAPGDPGRGLAA